MEGCRRVLPHPSSRGKLKRPHQLSVNSSPLLFLSPPHQIRRGNGCLSRRPPVVALCFVRFCGLIIDEPVCPVLPREGYYPSCSYKHGNTAISGNDVDVRYLTCLL